MVVAGVFAGCLCVGAGAWACTSARNRRSRRQLEEAQEPTASDSQHPAQLISQEPPVSAPTASCSQAPTELDQGMTGELLIEGGSGTNRRSFPEEWRLSQGQPPIELDDMAPKRPERVYQQIK
jgi:hypothetical protein